MKKINKLFCILFFHCFIFQMIYADEVNDINIEKKTYREFLQDKITHAKNTNSNEHLQDTNSQDSTTKHTDPNIPTANNYPHPRPIDEVAGGLKVEHRKPPPYAVLPTGKTLPKGIFRLEIPGAYTFGGGGFSAGGKTVDNGFFIERWMMGVALNYGISDVVSIGIGFPIVLSNHMGLDGNVFAANSQMYKKYFNKSVNQTAEYLSSPTAPANGCSGLTVAACKNQILNNDLSLPVNSTIVLPTGELYTIHAFVPVKDQIRNLIIKSTIPQDGDVGLGDIQIGILWDAVNERTSWRRAWGAPIYFSFGGGIRFPTGKFDIPMAFRQTGGDGTQLLPGGTLDGLIRWNFDYEPVSGLYLSWQNQMEYSFTRAVLNRSSMLHPGSFNTANPSEVQPGIPAPLNVGDGVPNTMKFSRKGVRFVGFLESSWGVGDVTRALRHLGFYAQGKYNIMQQNYLDNQVVYLFQDQFYLNDYTLHKSYGPQQAYSVVGGIKLSGLPDMIPIEFKAEYEYLFYGVNLFIAPMNFMMVLALYF